MRALRRGTLLLTLFLASCATLGQGILAPRFTAADQPAELRLLAPTPQRPTGGVAVRLWARVENPNPIGLTLSVVQGSLFLEGEHAAAVEFPLGLPLTAGGETVVPLDVVLNLEDVPGLARVATRALTGQPLSYALEGTVGVDAGPLGQPAFGPTTLLSGDVRVTR